MAKARKAGPHARPPALGSRDEEEIGRGRSGELSRDSFEDDEDGDLEGGSEREVGLDDDGEVDEDRDFEGGSTGR